MRCVRAGRSEGMAEIASSNTWPLKTLRKRFLPSGARRHAHEHMMSADVPVIVDATPPIITNYSRDQCEADALEAGLEPNALYDQVHELSGVRMSERTLDGMLLAHGVDPRTLTNKTDKARVLCGVVVPPGTPLSRSHSGGASPKTPPLASLAPVPLERRLSKRRCRRQCSAPPPARPTSAASRHVPSWPTPTAPSQRLVRCHPP